jgi:hypothetical protein
MRFFKEHLLGILIFSVISSLLSTFIYDHFSLGFIMAFLKPKAGDYRAPSAPSPSPVIPSSGSPQVGDRPTLPNSPGEEQNPAEPLLPADQDSGSIATAAIAAPFRLPGRDTAYVAVMIEVAGRDLLADYRGNILPIEFFIYGIDATDSKTADSLTEAFGIDLRQTQGSLQQNGIKFFGHVDLPPGRYSLRVGARNSTTGTYGQRMIPLEVPAFATGTPVLLSPFFPEPRGKWLMVREPPQRGVPYPFMLKEQPYIPAAMPVLGSGQEAQVLLIGYNLGDEEVQVRPQVLGANGDEVATGEITVLGREIGSEGGPDQLLAAFKAPNLEPGEYTLRVTISVRGRPESNSVQFVIGSVTTTSRLGKYEREPE